jgi:hypothetical protein
LIPPLQKLAQEGKFGPPVAKASAGRYSVTGGVLRVGTELPIISIPGEEAIYYNTGSWRGTLSKDEWGWWVSSTEAAGLNQILYFDNVRLNNANKMVVNLSATVDDVNLDRYYQVCDWVNNTWVDADADADCTGGGWRTLNKTESLTVAATGRAAINVSDSFTWHIYNGYWNKATGAGVLTEHEPNDTPLANFISSGGRIMLRAYSPTLLDAVHFIDAADIALTIDPVYFPARADVITGNQTGYSSYVLAENPAPGIASGDNYIAYTDSSGGSDDSYLQVSGTGEIIADFFVRFKGVRTYTGANAITVVAEYGCSAEGINHRPKIFNFSSNTWEDLTTTSITCSTTDVVGKFGFSTSSLWKYIQNGEVRVGWYGLSAGTQEIRLDYIYIIIGSTVADTSACEISFGTGVTTQCDRTNDLDSTLASTTSWMVGSELESLTFSHDYYAFDNDGDAMNGEAAVAAHITFPVRVPSAATLTGIVYSIRATPGSNYVWLQSQLKDWWGLSTDATNKGGYMNIGYMTFSSSTYYYIDPFDNGDYINDNCQHYINTYDDTITMRFSSSWSTLRTNFTRSFDWAMVSISWVEEDAPRRTLQYSYLPTNGRLRVGTEIARRAGAGGGNVGSWRGALAAEASDGFNWTASTSGTGLNQQLDFDYVKLNNANKMVIKLYASSASASLLRYYQICDWATTTAVDVVADDDCSGGWRTLNKVDGGSRVGIGDATRRTYTFHIYDGYWNKPNGAVTSTVNQVVSTTLSNFISPTNGTVRIRAYSTSTVYTTHMFNYAGIELVVDPIYFPQGLSVITGQSTGLSSYVNAETPPTLIAGGVGSTGDDGNYMSASGTASVTTEFYTVFRDVRTYSGANTIFVATKTGCSATGINYKLRMYNFSTLGWDDISADIACAAAGTNTTGYYAKNNVDLANYISNGEVRVGLLGSANGAQELRVDWMYIIVGTTNTNSVNCRIDFGSNNTNDCTSTRTIDTSSAADKWSVNSVKETDDLASDYYPLAGDVDGVAAHITSVLVPFTLTMATGTSPAGMVYAVYFRSGGTGKTMRAQLRYFSTNGILAASGFTNIGNTNASAANYTYANVLTSGYLFTAPENYIDPVASSTVLRMRTSASTDEDTATVADLDFMMVSYRWVEDPNSTDITLTAADQTVAFDALVPGSPVGPTLGLIVNTTNNTGFTIYAKRDDADTTMDLSTNASINIEDKTAWVAPGVTTTAGNAVPYTGTGLAFRLIYGSTDVPLRAETWWGNSDAEDENTLYTGIPTTSQAIAVSSLPTTIDGVGTKVGFRLDVPSTQRTGVYDGTVTFTATVNP